MYDILVVAAFIGRECNYNITMFDLQMLLFYSESNILKTLKHPLVNESAEAWSCSPIYPSIMKEYNEFSNKPIPFGNYVTYNNDIENDDVKVIRETIRSLYGNKKIDELLRKSLNNRAWLKAYSSEPYSKIDKFEMNKF